MSVSSAPQPSFQTAQLRQVSFVSTNEQLAHIYAYIANVAPYQDKKRQAVNIRGVVQNKVGDSVETSITPGVGFGIPFPGTQSQTDLQVVRDAVSLLFKLNFTEKTVVIANLPPVPAQVARAQRLLNCQDVDILLSYIDESLGQIYDVDNVELAEQTLQNAEALDNECKLQAVKF